MSCITIACSAITMAEAAIKWTVDYTRERKAFGTVVADFQNTRFVLAQLEAEISALRVFIDRCLELANVNELNAVDAAKAKMLSTELLGRTADQCLQLHGGYGYTLEYPIGRLFIDSRVRRIAGGSTEIMKEIISRDIFSK